MTRWSPGRFVAIAVALAVATLATISVIAVIRHPDIAQVHGPCDCGPGYITCTTDPDHCDGGDRLPGGDVVVAVGKSPRSWNPASIDGTAGDTVEEMTPLLPSASVFLPSGKADYNRDLLAGEPRVSTTALAQVVYPISPRAVWNDGTGVSHPVSPQDFVFTWRIRNGRDKRLPVPTTAGYDQIASVVAGPDGQTVVVTFRHPYADWPALFSLLEPYWFAAATTGADPTDVNNMTDTQLEKAFAALQDAPRFSAGPFMISKVTPGGDTVEVPNPLWYGAIKPTLTTITFRPTDDRQNVTLLQHKDIDVFSSATPDNDTVQALTGTAGISFHVEFDYSWEQLQFNTADPFLRDAKLREAMMDAINVQELIDHTVRPYFPDARRLYSHNLFPGQDGYEDITRMVDRVEGVGDPDTARRLLAAAGYTGVGRPGGLKTPAGRHVTVTLVHTDTVERDVDARMIGYSIESLGATVTDRPTADLSAALTAHRFGIAEFAQTESALHGTALDLWSAHGAGNFTGWGDPLAGRRLTPGPLIPSQEQLAVLLNEQDKVLTAAHVVLPLYQLPQLIAFDSRFIGIRLNPAGGYITYNTQEWGLLKPAQ